VCLFEEHHTLLDEVLQLTKKRPVGAPVRLFAFWKAISVRRTRDEKITVLYRMRLLILRLHDNWDKDTLDQLRVDMPPTNNATERAIGRWRICSHSTRGFKKLGGIGIRLPVLLGGFDLNQAVRLGLARLVDFPQNRQPECCQCGTKINLT
jgi:hypothetical protein